MIETLFGKNKCIGLNQTIKAIKEGLVETVYLAEDADGKIKDNIKSLCSAQNIELIMAVSMKDLGFSAGITVGSAVVSLLK